MVITNTQKFWLESDFVLELLKQIPAYIFWKDKDSVYLGCNNALASSLGLSSPEDIVGKTDYDLSTTKEESDSFRADDKQVIESKQPKLNIEECQTLPDGRRIILLTNKVPLFDKQNNVIGILGIYYNITDRKQMEEDLRKAKEEAEAANERQSIFIANMSHDIRLPLNGLIGMASLLEEEAHNPTEKERASNVHKCGNQLSNLLIAILENVRSNQLSDKDIHKSTFGMQKLLQDIYEIYLLNAQSKKIDFKIELDPAIPPFVVSDRLKLYSILFNLVGNAIKFTEKGKVIIKVKSLGSTKGSNQTSVEFSVIDTGIGISEDFKKKLFDRFSRETPSYKGLYKGYGIGLNTSQNYITSLGSEIHVASEKGKGSTFSFQLKMEIGKAEDVNELEEKLAVEHLPTVDMPQSRQASISTAPSTNTSLSSVIVLLVEDDALAMKIAEMGVNKAGYSVIKASTGEEALELAKKKRYDIILTDIGLPGMSGDEFAKKVRAWEKATEKKPVPIIALTGHGGDPEIIKTCLSAGINEVLNKPTKIDKVEQTLKKYIDQTHLGIKKETKMVWTLPETDEELFQISNHEPFNLREGIRVAGSEKQLKEYLPMFIDSCKSIRMELEVAQEAKDWKHVAYLAHKIMSAAIIVGATKMIYACRYMGNYYKNDHTVLLEKLYQQMMQVINETQKAIEDHLKNEKKS